MHMKDHNEKSDLQEFREHREAMDQKIMEQDHLGIKRFYNIDTNTYRDGILSGQTKELLGLVASTVLRCNDCIDYHIEQCVEAGWNKQELLEAIHVAMVVGGTIVIPHLRHAMQTIETLEQEGAL